MYDRTSMTVRCCTEPAGQTARASAIVRACPPLLAPRAGAANATGPCRRARGAARRAAHGEHAPPPDAQRPLPEAGAASPRLPIPLPAQRATGRLLAVNTRVRPPPEGEGRSR